MRNLIFKYIDAEEWVKDSLAQGTLSEEWVWTGSHKGLFEEWVDLGSHKGSI
jgi:hypothetical protein